MSQKEKGKTRKGWKEKVLRHFTTLVLMLCAVFAFNAPLIASAEEVNISAEEIKASEEDTSVNEAASFTVSIPDGALVKGSSRQLKISPADAKVKSYASSNKAVIKVTTGGKITALKTGSANITVTLTSGQKKVLKLTVMADNSDMVVNRTVDGKKALWRFKDGKVCKDKGFSTDGRTWFYCENGLVSSKTGLYTGTVNKVKALWFYKVGRVMTGYTGGYRVNDTTVWFVQRGQVDKTLSGNFYAGGKTYRVKNGKVIKSVKGKVNAFYGQTFGISIGEEKKIESENVKITLTNQYQASKWVDGIVSINGDEHYFGLEYDENEGTFSVSYVEYIKEVSITCVKTAGSRFYLKVSKAAEVKKPFRVSGRETGRYVTKDFEYLESENLIIFLPKGMHFNGNVMVKLEEYVAAVENETGYKRKVVDSDSYYTRMCVQKSILGTDIFRGVDPDCKKVHVYIDVTEDESPECVASYKGDDYNYILIHEYDLDVNNEEYFFSTFIHEYTHYVHLTNHAGVSNIINEGYASYVEELVTSKFTGLTGDKLYQERFYGYLIKKGSVTAANAEKLFIADYRSSRTDAYRYGCYFVKYLNDTYGRKAFNSFLKKVTEELEKQQKTNSSIESLSGEQVSKLVKTAFSENVFKGFAAWLNNHPEYTKETDY